MPSFKRGSIYNCYPAYNDKLQCIRKRYSISAIFPAIPHGDGPGRDE